MFTQRWRYWRLSCVAASCAIFAVVTASMREAEAQGTTAAAIVLFDEAQRLRDAGRLEEACAKFGESYRLDPQLGALLNYADCVERTGKPASAYAAFRDAVELSRQKADPRHSVARSRAEALEPKLMRIVIDLPTSVVASEITVTLDGTGLTQAAMGSPLPLDPGEHHIEVSASGYLPWTTSVVLQTEGQTQHIVVPQLTRASAGRSALEPRDDSSRLILGYSAIGLGLVGVGVGVGYAVSAQSKANEHARLCPSGVSCEPGTNRRLETLEEEVRFNRNIAIAGIAGGALLGALGTVVLLWPPGTESPDPQTTVAVRNVRMIPAGPGLTDLQLVMVGAF